MERLTTLVSTTVFTFSRLAPHEDEPQVAHDSYILVMVHRTFPKAEVGLSHPMVLVSCIVAPGVCIWKACV